MSDHQPDTTPQPEHGAAPDGSVPLTDHVKAGPGGAMTDEVGVLTGDVTVTTEPGPDGTATVRIQYTGAEEWYTLTGSPRPAATRRPRRLPQGRRRGRAGRRCRGGPRSHFVKTHLPRSPVAASSCSGRPAPWAARTRGRGGQVVVSRRETWTTEEFGTSHTGAVEAVLADGTVPNPVYFDSGSGGGGDPVSQWSVYDGRWPHVPRAAAVRAVCSCGWAGPEHLLDWETIGDQDLAEAGDEQADACDRDWYGHTDQVEATTVPLPESVTSLLVQLEEEIDRLTRTSPVAAVRAARRLEVVAERVGYWAARATANDLDTKQAAAQLGLNEEAARKLLARLGRWSSYR